MDELAFAQAIADALAAKLGPQYGVWRDKKGDVIPQQGVRRHVIDLTAAYAEQEYDVPGDFLYFDVRTTGTFTFKLNNPSEYDMQAGPNFLLSHTGLRKLYLTSAAQPGSKIYLWYGYDASVVPQNQSIANIGSITTPVDISDRAARVLGVVQPRTMQMTSTYYRNSVSAALGTVVTPAANVNGILVEAQVCLGNGDFIRLMAKTSAPANMNDAAAHTLGLTGNVAQVGAGPLVMNLPYVIPAGLGLYEQAGGATAASIASYTYKVL